MLLIADYCYNFAPIAGFVRSILCMCLCILYAFYTLRSYTFIDRDSRSCVIQSNLLVFSVCCCCCFFSSMCYRDDSYTSRLHCSVVCLVWVSVSLSVVVFISVVRLLLFFLSFLILSHSLVLCIVCMDAIRQHSIQKPHAVYDIFYSTRTHTRSAADSIISIFSLEPTVTRVTSIDHTLLAHTNRGILLCALFSARHLCCFFSLLHSHSFIPFQRINDLNDSIISIFI